MSTVKIQKGLPIPIHRSRTTKYPWADMGVGDSFWVAGLKSGALLNTAKGWASRTKRDWLFKTRIETDAKGNPGIRIWRVQ